MRSVIKIMIGNRLLLLMAAMALVTLLLISCGHTDQFSISGQVTSGGSGLSGVTLTLGGAGSATTATDANGNYSFGNLNNGSYTITPSKTGYTFSPASSSQTLSSASITAVNFLATPMATFSISGTATLGGSGLSGVTMLLSGASTTATTDASGNYTFSGLVNGSYTVTPSKTGFVFSPASSVQTINGANITAINFPATSVATLSIYGNVTSGGIGLPGVAMTLSVRGLNTATATTDANGTYIFSGLLNDNYTITPNLTGFTFSPTSSTQTISGTNITGLNFTTTATQGIQVVTCPSSGTTNVTIQDFSFTPFAVIVGATGIVKWTNNGPSLHTVTSGTKPNNDGKFNSGNLATGASVCVQFSATGLYPYFSALDPAMNGNVTVQ